MKSFAYDSIANHVINRMGILESERLVTINVNLLQDKFSAFNYHIGIIRKLAILRSSPSYIRHHLVYTHCMKKRIYVLRKFVKRAEKIIFSLVFICFRFTEISYFLSFPSNENVRKQYLSANAYFYVNMKFSYTIAGRKDEIFCRIVTKTSDFLLVFRSTLR